jgi:hypothetical protein
VATGAGAEAALDGGGLLLLLQLASAERKPHKIKAGSHGHPAFPIDAISMPPADRFCLRSRVAFFVEASDLKQQKRSGGPLRAGTYSDTGLRTEYRGRTYPYAARRFR